MRSGQRLSRMALVLVLTSLIGFSADAGPNRWTVVGPAADIQTMAVDPDNPANLYAAGFDLVAHSRDRGATWTVSPLPGLSFGEFIRVAPSLPSTIYLLGFQTLYRSTSGGTSWSSRKTPKTAQFQNDLKVDVRNSNILVVAASNFCFLGCSGGGVFRSTDGGGSWDGIGLQDTNVRTVALHPTETQIIYATTETQLLRTGNRGGAWRIITPPGSGAIRGVVVDPVMPDMIFAATEAGVFRSPNEGQDWVLVRAANFGATIAPPLPHWRHLFVASDGLALSVDQGQSWRSLATAGSGLDIGSLEQLVIGRDIYYMVVDIQGLPGQIIAYEIRQPRRRAVR
jgi:photosystem II stability/assembly factor-like uncharacterized protein